MLLKDQQHLQRKRRVRARITGTAERPRLCVTRTIQHISAQLIDDVAGKTLCMVSDKNEKGTKTERATAVGKGIAKKAKDANITEAVFDRGGRKYHGRVKALAEAARGEGLTF